MGAWLAHILGLDDQAGPFYAFWSGFGSDVTEFLVFGSLIGLLRKHNCHVRWCFRIGRHPVDGTPYVVCSRHHPQGAPTVADIAEHTSGGA